MNKKPSPAGVIAKAAAIAKSARIAPSEPFESNATTPRPVQEKRRPTSAASVVAQVRKKLDKTTNVLDLDAARLKQTRLHFSSDLGDIRVEFPGPDHSPMVLDLSFLGQMPRLAKPLAMGFRIYGIGKRPKSVIGRRSELQVGLLKFLSDKGLLHIGLEDFDRSLWNQFMHWLNSKVVPETGEPIHPKTRATTFGAVVAVLKALKSVPEFSRTARIAFDARPRVTWSYMQIRTKARERLSFETLQALDNAVEKDIEALDAKFIKCELLLKDGSERLATKKFDLLDLATCVAYIAEKYPRGLPSIEVLKLSDPDLYRCLNPDGKATKLAMMFRIRTLIDVLYPSNRDLVPIVVFLAIESALNPSTLFELVWSDITYGELLGERVIRFGGAKWRAGEDPLVPMLAARIQPVLDLIARLTKLVRVTVNHLLSDRLLLISRINPVGEISSCGRGLGVDDRGIKRSDGNWSIGLKQFCKEYEIPYFTLSQIRATIGDEIAFREGIVVSSQVLGHKDIRITDQHYVSNGTRWREAELLGKAMLFMARWFESDGNIDPRRRRLTPRMDRGAATPGFHCFDPYDSPWPMQRKNRLCTAYGRCPSCPLAAADIHDPGSVALYMALRLAIFDAQGRIVGEAWLARYGQVLVDLDAMLKHVPIDVMESAKRFHVVLPPVE
ncbi:MAG: hypothetical protein ABI076_00310 [Acidobacteriaceae bacterium]